MKFAEKYKQLEALVKKMNLPPHRRKVVNATDVRWLSRNMKTTNVKHKNYEEAQALIEELL